MSQISNWFSMGGYAHYIWPAYALMAVVLLINLAGIRRQRRKTESTLQQWYQQSKTVQELQKQ